MARRQQNSGEESITTKKEKKITSIHFYLFGFLLLAYSFTLLLPQAKRHAQNWIYNRYTIDLKEVRDTRFHLREYQNLKAPIIRRFNFVLSEGEGTFDGIRKRMLLVNNQYPGPTIEVDEGDEVVVTVVNNLKDKTIIHWHGIPMKSTPYFDGVAGVTQCGIPVNETLEYRFNLGGYVGTTWYHAHYGTQRMDGISGAFIVHSKNESIPSYDQDVVIQLSDLYHSFSTPIVEKYLSRLGFNGIPGDEPVPDGGTLNGIKSESSQPFNFSFQPGLTYRIRLINTGAFAPFHFSIDQHLLTIVEVDGVVVIPKTVRSLKIAVAQRYSVLITTNQELGAYWIRATISEEMFRYTNPILETKVLGLIRYGVIKSLLPKASAISESLPDYFDEYSLVPKIPEIPPDSSLTYLITVSSQKSSNGMTYMFFNSTSWEPLSTATTLQSHVGFDTPGSQVIGDQFIINIPYSEMSTRPRVVDIIVQNFDESGHPFHLHGHSVYIVGKGPGRYSNQPLNLQLNSTMRRDVVSVAKYSWVVLRFVADYPGIFAFHCHTSWHMASGLLMQFINMPNELKAIEIPSAIIDQCKR